MDEICAALSALLEGGGSSYKIYYEEDLLDALPDDVRNRDTLEAALKNLYGGGYIDVKYARGSAFCVAFLKKFFPAPAEPATETENTQSAEAPVAAPAHINKAALYLTVALSAFFGGILGGLISALIGAAI